MIAALILSATLHCPCCTHHIPHKPRVIVRRDTVYVAGPTEIHYVPDRAGLERERRLSNWKVVGALVVAGVAGYAIGKQNGKRVVVNVTPPRGDDEDDRNGRH